MPSAVRLGDVCSGHGCYPPRPNIAASNDVNVNGIGFHRVSDGWATHCCTSIPTECHDGTTIQGSKTVNVNGLPAARIGDSVSCGSTCLQGSSNVFAGG